MRTTGPTVRRRNHAWLQMRSLDRRAARLARRQGELEKYSDEEANEADVEGDDLDSSGDESASSLDESDDELDDQEDGEQEDGEDKGDEKGIEPTMTAPPALTPVNTGLPALTARPIGPGLALGAADGAEGADEADDSDAEESADESTTATSSSSTSTAAQTSSSSSSSTTITDPGATSPTTITGPGTTSSTTVTGPGPTRSSSSSLDELITSLTGTSLSASSTAAPSPSVPITGNTQLNGADPPGRQANEREAMSVKSRSGLDSGQIAGIVLGILAFIGLLVGAAFFWRKRRRDRGLPFFPATLFRLKDDDDPQGPSVTGPLPGRVAGPNLVRTNTQIMDDLMKAAYATNDGTNDMQGAYAPPVPKLPPQLPPQDHEHEHGAVGLGFMDEKAYAALAGPPTPATPQKPVMRWLDEVKPPSMPDGPEIPPTPEMPASARTSRVMMAGGRVPEPPKPAYYGRDTMTTDTTNTSVRWYG